MIFQRLLKQLEASLAITIHARLELRRAEQRVSVRLGPSLLLPPSPVITVESKPSTPPPSRPLAARPLAKTRGNVVQLSTRRKVG